jgi:hypothetical protein
MVKPPLRTKSIGFKVSEEEYKGLETAAQASGRTLGEWCREAILRGGSASDAAAHDPALAEILLFSAPSRLQAHRLIVGGSSGVAGCLSYARVGFCRELSRATEKAQRA